METIQEKLDTVQRAYNNVLEKQAKQIMFYRIATLLFGVLCIILTGIILNN